MNSIQFLVTILLTAQPFITNAEFQPLFSKGIHERNLESNDEFIGFVSSEYIGAMSTLDEVIYTACESATQNDHRRQLFQGEHVFSVSSVAESTFFTFTCPTDSVLGNIPSGLVVEKNGLVFADNAPKSWGLDRIDQPMLPLSKTEFKSAYTGKGATVYVIDTGINKDHVDFGGRASFGGDFVNEANKADMNGHGTHCSGTATGATYGIAHEANVIGVKVLSGSGSGSYSGVVNGINWAIQHAGSTSSVFSMSLGGGASSTVNAAVKAAAAAGHIVVVAAGNSNADACYSSPSSAGGDAQNGGVVTVMASDSSDNLASYSNWGTCTDIIAPGSHITSAWIGSTTAQNTISGTSMATPHVAGVAALLLQKHNFNKQNAQDELLSLRVWNEIDGKTYGGPNAMLQIPTYTGAPTAPTPRPTPGPTPEPPKLCAGSICTTNVGLSSFGASWPKNELISGDGVVASTDLCSPVAAGSYEDKIVLVNRGTCYFYTKVLNAENAGAIAVVIINTKGSPLIDPNYHYEDNVDIPSLMIQYEVGQEMKPVWNSEEVGYGDYSSEDGTTKGPTTAAPTKAPTTAAPTKAPTTAAPTAAPTPKPTRFRPGNNYERREWRFCKRFNSRACERHSDRCTWNAEKVDGEWKPLEEDFKAKKCLPNFLFN